MVDIMIIAESREFDVIFKVNADYKQDKVYTVIYGLQVDTFNTLAEALDSFNACLMHAAECEGLTNDH